MNVKDAMRVLDVSRTTMMEWLDSGDVFPGARKLSDSKTAPWYIPADEVEKKRLELIADLERSIEKISVPAESRFDVDLVPG